LFKLLSKKTYLFNSSFACQMMNLYYCLKRSVG